VIRTYSSTDPVRDPDPATNPAAYNKICQATPNAPDCALPLYWPAPQQILRTTEGMHRFIWDMHYDVIAAGGGGRGGGGGANGAVPHRTYPSVNSPWVSPGTYTVRLTADGKSMKQDIVVKMDPRVKITPEVKNIFALTDQLTFDAMKSKAALFEARAALAKAKSAGNEALAKKLEELAPGDLPTGGGGGFGGGGFGGFGGADATPAPATLTTIPGALIGAVMPMQGAEMAPTAVQLENCKKQEAAYAAVMAKWTALKATIK